MGCNVVQFPATPNPTALPPEVATSVPGSHSEYKCKAGTLMAEPDSLQSAVWATDHRSRISSGKVGTPPVSAFPTTSLSLSFTYLTMSAYADARAMATTFCNTSRKFRMVWEFLAYQSFSTSCMFLTSMSTNSARRGQEDRAREYLVPTF